MKDDGAETVNQSVNVVDPIAKPSQRVNQSLPAAGMLLTASSTFAPGDSGSSSRSCGGLVLAPETDGVKNAVADSSPARAVPSILPAAAVHVSTVSFNTLLAGLSGGVVLMPIPPSSRLAITYSRHA